MSSSTTSDVNGGPVFSRSSNPATVTDAAGYVWTAWAANISGRWSIYFSDTAGGESSWTTPVELDSGATTQDTSPSISVDGSGTTAKVAVAWQTQTSYAFQASSDGYVYDYSANGGSTWTKEGTQANFGAFDDGSLTYVEAPVVAWDDGGNLLLTVWACWSNSPYSTCTVLIVLGYTGGTSFCSGTTCDGGLYMEGASSTSAYYTQALAMACSDTTTDCAIAYSVTNSGGTTTYGRVYYSTDDFNAGGSNPMGPTTVDTLSSTAGDVAFLVSQGDMVYTSAGDSYMVAEVQVGAVFNFNVGYYYTTNTWAASTPGSSPAGGTTTTTSSASIAVDTSTGGPFVSWVDTSGNVDETWASSSSGTFLAPQTVAAGESTSVGVTTSVSPFRTDVVYVGTGSTPQVYYAFFIGLSASGSDSPSQIDLGMSVSLTATGTNGAPAYGYAWSGLPTGCTPSNTASLSCTPTGSGTFTPSVVVSDSIGETVTVTLSAIKVNPQLVVALSPVSGGFDAGQTVALTATPSGGTGTYASYVWQLNGSTISGVTGNTYSYKFLGGGSYVFAVDVTDSLPYTSAFTSATLTVNSPLTISAILATPNPTEVGTQVNFTATVAGGTPALTYAWALGGGVTSPLAAPTNTYTTPGNYTVYLNVTDAATTPVTVSSSTVVKVDSPLTVGASASPTTILAGQSTTLTGTVSGGTPAYTDTWVFGDGTGSATGLSVTHKYAAAGSFTATFWANDSFGYGKKVAVPIVVLLPITLSTPTATPDPTNTTTPVHFSVVASGGSGSFTYSWNFGDGTAAAAGQNVTHTYATVSTGSGFLVNVTAKDSGGRTASATRYETVIAPGGGNPLTVSPLSVNPNPVVVSNSATFTVTVSGGTSPYTYAWAFGDGGTANTATGTTTHTYTNVGSYQATLTVTDSAHDSGQTSPVTVNVLGAGNFLTSESASPSTADVGMSVTFTGSISGGVTPYHNITFYFGDGSTPDSVVPGVGQTQISVVHIYRTPGSFTVHDVVVDGSSATATSADLPLTIDPAITVKVAATPTAVDLGGAIALEATATGGSASYSTYTWDFGGTGTPIVSTSRTQSWTPTAASPAGGYNITVSVNDTNGGVGDGYTPVMVYSPIVVTLSSDVNGKPAPMWVNFTAAVTGGNSVYSYVWNFGDGNTIAAKNGASIEPQEFPKQGVFMVTVTVTDTLGGSKTAYDNVTVDAANPVTNCGTSCGSFSSFPWWLLVLLVAVILAILLIVILARRRREPAHEDYPPEEVAMAGAGAYSLAPGGDAEPTAEVTPVVSGEGGAIAALPESNYGQSYDDGGAATAAEVTDLGLAGGALAGSEMGAPETEPEGAATEPAPETSEPVPCSICGAPLLFEGAACPQCGIATPSSTPTVSPDDTSFARAGAAGLGVGLAAGAAMSESASAPPTGGLTSCPQCQGPLDPDMSCPTCQVRWEPEAAPSPPMADEVTPVISGPDGGPSPSSAPGELMNCPQCGTELLPGRVCPSCQVSWERQEDEPASPPAPPEPSPAPDDSPASEMSNTPESPPVPAPPPPPPTFTAPVPPEPQEPVSPSAESEPPAPSAPSEPPTPASHRPGGCFICGGPLEAGYCPRCNMHWADDGSQA